jgi:hypothetical protein
MCFVSLSIFDLPGSRRTYAVDAALASWELMLVGLGLVSSAKTSELKLQLQTASDRLAVRF